MVAPQKIVITGVGVVSPIGVGREAFGAALQAGQSGIRRITRFGNAPLPAKLAAELRDFDAKQYVTPRKSLKVMCPEIQAGFAASVLAMQDAQLPPGSVEPDRLGVLFGAEMLYGDPLELVDLYRACIVNGEFDYAHFGRMFPTKMFPLWLLKYLPNMAACHIGIAQDARGPNNTIVLGEVSSLVALAEAVQVIERGLADVMIVGGTSSRLSLTGLLYRGACLLSQRDDIPSLACRPFDRDRDGMVNGEGAGVVIVEGADFAARRGAKVLAEIGACYHTFGAPRSEAQRQSAIRRSITTALELAACPISELDHVNAHGLSTPVEDRLEAQAIADTLSTVPVTALKSYFGNLGAAGGIVELIGSILALETGAVPPSLTYRTPDPACPVQVIRGEPRPVEQPAALALSQSRTGQAAAVLIRRP